MVSGSSDAPALFWFRDDLRLADNPGLDAACRAGAPLILLYVLDDSGDGTRPLGAATRWWLHHSLESLSDRLAGLGQILVLRRGPARDIVRDLVEETGSRQAFWNRRYGFAGELDADIARSLEAAGCATATFGANLLFEPDQVRSGKGDPFRVYSAFWRAAQRIGDIRAALPSPRSMPPPAAGIAGESLAALALLPTRSDRAGGSAAILAAGRGRGRVPPYGLRRRPSSRLRGRPRFPRRPGNLDALPASSFRRDQPGACLACPGRNDRR